MIKHIAKFESNNSCPLLQHSRVQGNKVTKKTCRLCPWGGEEEFINQLSETDKVGCREGCCKTHIWEKSHIPCNFKTA